MHRVHMCVCVCPRRRLTYKHKNARSYTARLWVSMWGKEVYKHTYEVTVFHFVFAAK